MIRSLGVQPELTGRILSLSSSGSGVLADRGVTAKERRLPGAVFPIVVRATKWDDCLAKAAANMIDSLIS